MIECPWEFDRYGYCSTVMGGSAFLSTAALITCYYTTNSVSQVQSLYQSKSLRLSQLIEEVLIRLNKPGTTQREWKQTKRLMFEGRGWERCEVQMHALFPPNHALQKED